MVRMQDSLRPKSYLDLEFSIRQLQKDQPETSVFLGKVGIGIILEHLLEGKLDTYDLVFLILDDGITSDPEKFVTEIRIPVAEK